MGLEHLIDVKIQPIFNVQTNTVGYAELLLRAVDPRANTGDILKAFERNNQSARLDTYILKRACKIINENKDLTVKLTVNLTKQTMEIPNVYWELAELISSQGVDSRRIIIELNEDTLFGSETAIRNINGFIGCGIGIAIDDFGRGNTSLANISKFNIDMVKYDREFLSIKDEDSVRVITDMVSKMHKVGIETVIEGVETQEQLEAVKLIGYGNIQGFILAKPMTTRAYTKLYM